MGGWSAPSHDRFTPGKETRYPLYRRLGGPRGRFGQVREISSQPGFDPRTVQSVASGHRVCTVPAHSSLPKLKKKKSVFFRPAPWQQRNMHLPRGAATDELRTFYSQTGYNSLLLHQPINVHVFVGWCINCNDMHSTSNIPKTQLHFMCQIILKSGAWGGVVVKALRY